MIEAQTYSFLNYLILFNHAGTIVADVINALNLYVHYFAGFTAFFSLKTHDVAFY